MPDLAASARRLLRRLAAPRPAPGETDPGVATAATGSGAVAAVEAGVSDAAALGGSFPAAAAADAFARETATGAANLLDRLPAAVGAASPRGALATALGLAEAGRRGAAFLAGPDLGAARDLLARAAERRLPLVVHLACRAGAGTASALGSGHEALWAAAGTGALTVAAANVQEAVDLALIARRTSEEALVPAVVAADAETALGIQDVFLPSPELARSFLAGPGDTVHSAAAAQETLFGRHRRRLPRGHDPERPVLAGAALGPEAFALAAAGRRVYLEPPVAERFEAACERLAGLTGRRLRSVSAHRTEGAKLVLLALGAAVETAEAAADHLRESGLAVGVLGVRRVSPFPEAAVVELLSGVPAVAVLERVEAPLAAEGPLTAAVRAALDRARENQRFGAETHPGLPALTERKAPRLASVFYGLGGLPLAAADLAALACELDREWRSPLWLGMDFAPDAAADPKRQALLDALHRDHPRSARLGLPAASSPPELRPQGAVTLALHGGGENLTAEVAALLHRALGGHLRHRPALGGGTDLLTWSKQPFADPGDRIPADLAVWTGPGPRPAIPSTALAPGGAVLLPAPGGGEPALPPALARVVAEGNVFTVPVPAGAAADDAAERLLGAVVGVLLARDAVEVRRRKLLDARGGLLEEQGLPGVERRRLLDHFSAGLEEAAPLAVAVSAEGSAAAEAIPAEVADPLVPEAVRRLGRTDAFYDSLPRFWDQVGVLYRRSETSLLAPDPYLAAGMVPALSAAFRSSAPGRALLPAFDPAPCTGCGGCWTACPHGAVEPAVLGPEALLDAGMRRAAATGTTVDPLRQVKGKLAAALGRELAGVEGSEVGPLLSRAFAGVIEKLPLPEERKTAVGEAFASVEGQLAPLALARTGAFFDGPEGEKKGSGEAFTLALDPDACTGCGLCVAACEPGALAAAAGDAERTAAARALLVAVQELPDPTTETLERARRHPEVGPLAGALLSRAARRTMSGGEGAEPGSGAALAVRQVLAASAFHLEPRRRRRLEAIADLRNRLAEAVRDAMAGALPASDLDALARGLETVGRPDAELSEVTARVETAFEGSRVDVLRLRRLVAAAREVAELEAGITGEGSGLGRAPFGVVLGPGPALEWAGTFPWNPFAVPVTVDACGETAELAKGLAAGLLQQAAEEARLLRRAERELRNPAEAARGEPPVATADLSEEERDACPPLWVIVSEDALAGAGLAGLLDLLAGDLPVKVLSLGDPPLPAAGEETAESAAAPMVAASGPRPNAVRLAATAGWEGTDWGLVARSSPARPEHLEAAVAAALASAGPALLSVHAPSPRRGGFKAEETLARAEQAVASGAFELFAATAEEQAPGEPAATAEEVAALERRHEAALAELAAGYEGRIAGLEAELKVEMARKVRARLLALATRGAESPGTAAEGDGETRAEA